MIVDSGLQHIADQLAEQAEATMSHMAVGTGETAESPGDTSLETELARVPFTSKTRSAKKVVYVADFGPGVGTGALKEVGLLNAVSGGSLLSRITFPVKNKGAGDSLEITIEHTFARQ
ncbi:MULTISPECIES: hypothetical protein [unclassified Nitrospina]|uniref:hypothetical protein n=1 Tax=unclassified Nitrospina TaxID=2638683 RepID=UPI003F998D17